MGRANLFHKPIHFVAPLFPLAGPLLLAGAMAGGFLGLLTGSLAIACSALVLFTVCGLTWRRDMPAIFPFCLAFQWVGATIGYIFFQLYGYFPGGHNPAGVDTVIWASSLGFLALGFGIRLGFNAFARAFRRVLAAPYPNYSLRRLSWLVVALFAIQYMFDVAPKSIWFGGAQIIDNMLELRYVPYFVLVLMVFQNSRGYRYLWMTTAIVILPQTLTGFSGYKEMLFVIFLCALFQWRPWSNVPKQRVRNFRVAAGAVLGSILIVWSGLIWQGGLKAEWRQAIWQSEVTSSPIERMGRFVTIAGEVATNLDTEFAVEDLIKRLSSGSLYFSYVLSRVPDAVPHENGMLIQRAINNATVPRFLFPDKPNLGGDSWLVQTYAGVKAAGDEVGASIGLGYMPEFYIDFGYAGLVVLCALYGFGLAVCMRLFAAVAYASPVFIALSFTLLMNYFTVFDGSFIKILAGVLQQTLIMSVVVYFSFPTVSRWLRGAPQRLQQSEAAISNARLHSRAVR